MGIDGNKHIDIILFAYNIYFYYFFKVEQTVHEKNPSWCRSRQCLGWRN